MKTMRNPAAKPPGLNKEPLLQAQDLNVDLISETQEANLVFHEAAIEKYYPEFFPVGRALRAIQVKKLYRSEYASFGEYCLKKWQISRIHAHRLAQAAVVMQLLESKGFCDLPLNERQARLLARLTPSQIKKAWELTLALSEGERPTYGLVKKAVEIIRLKHDLGHCSFSESWGLNLLPLMEKAICYCKKGDREAVTYLVNKMTLLLGVGCFGPRDGEQAENSNGAGSQGMI